MKVKTIVNLLVIFVLTAVFMIPSSIWAINNPDWDLCWSTVGSAGTIDESDISEAYFYNDYVSIKLTPTLPASVTIRYNIEPFNYINTYPCIPRIGYSDSGSSGQIILSLIEVSLLTGARKTLETFNSDSYLQVSGFQSKELDWEVFFDFKDHIYYIEANIYRYNQLNGAKLNFIKFYPNFAWDPAT